MWKKCEVILNDSRVPLPGDGNMIAKLQQEMELLKFKLNEIKKQISEKESTQWEPTKIDTIK